jgi:hypothetical protein
MCVILKKAMEESVPKLFLVTVKIDLKNHHEKYEKQFTSGYI